jgi:hypothetical protein
MLRVSTEVLALCKANKLGIDFTVGAMDHVCARLEAMSRFQDADIFECETVALSETSTQPLRAIHAPATARSPTCFF